MIYVINELVNDVLNQKIYDELVEHVHIEQIACSEIDECIQIHRIRCTNCNKTHAIMFSQIIPYS